MLSAYGFPFLLAALVSYILTPYIKTLAFKIGAIADMHFAPTSTCLLYTSPSPRERSLSSIPS